MASGCRRRYPQTAITLIDPPDSFSWRLSMVCNLTCRTGARPILLLLAALLTTAVPAAGQDRLPAMPGYERYREMQPQMSGAVRSGALTVSWAADGSSFEYTQAGQRFRYDVAARRAAPAPAPAPAAERGGQPAQAGPRPERGRQAESALSPDGRMRAFYRDRNLWISDAAGGAERQLTTDGSEAERIKYGTASWVYGEELRQTTAMWWSPDGGKLAFYRFDESPVKDYYLQLGQTQLQSSLDIEAYPKAGTDNPIVDLYVYDLASGAKVRIDVRDGRPFANDVVGYYVYRVGWSPDGAELIFNRTNRRQNIMEFTACNPSSGACRVVLREEWLPSWTTNSPEIRWLADNRRFIWASERNGFRNYLLHDFSGRQIAVLTNHDFEATSIVRVDEAAGVLWYMARSGDNHMKLQLHRVGLDGRGDVRLTDPAFHHTVSVAPDGRHFIDVVQTHDTPPATRLVDARGSVLAELATSDLSRFEQLGMRRVEMYTFTAADGVTQLHGMLHKPSNFDPARKYPVLFSVYGGPGSAGARETFTTPHAYTEYGFLVVTLDGRNSGGRGKRVQDAIYENLGVVEVDDFAAGIRALHHRPYVDGNRVGVFGTSYGGYVSALALLRHPDAFHAAAAMSPVTDWKHYDTIYTERYMWIPQENEAGYRAGSAMQYVNDLRGRLMIFFGTADNNVHPSNSMELIAALQRAGKSFDVQIGPDRGHVALNAERMMEFFIENLVLNAGR
jgi:dipeptidyl-peptidase 4